MYPRDCCRLGGVDLRSIPFGNETSLENRLTEKLSHEFRTSHWTEISLTMTGFVQPS